MNAVSITFVNAHLQDLEREAQGFRLRGSLAPRRSMRDRVAALADGLSRLFGVGTPAAFLPPLKDYPYGG